MEAFACLFAQQDQLVSKNADVVQPGGSDGRWLGADAAMQCWGVGNERHPIFTGESIMGLCFPLFCFQSFHLLQVGNMLVFVTLT